MTDKKSYTGNRHGFVDPVTVSFTCSKDLRTVLHRASAQHDRAVSDIIREAISHWLIDNMEEGMLDGK